MIICLMGPTASGKTGLAVTLVEQFPCEIISVDSALIYRGMDIGTAKPSPELLARAPHRLINRLDPKEPYSAGQFLTDALHEVKDILSRGKIPLLVGGTMLYFRVLQQGIAELPKADAMVRAELTAWADKAGWEALHAFLTEVDPDAAKRIQPRDSQRIQRALEVYKLTGKTITAWQSQNTNPLSQYRVYNVGLMPSDRAALHERIALRFKQMLADGLLEEVKRLYDRGDLTPDLPSIRSVGYRQVWEYLSGSCSYEAMQEQAIAATRQLAKRQMTWLRSWPSITLFDSESNRLEAEVIAWMHQTIGLPSSE